MPLIHERCSTDELGELLLSFNEEGRPVLDCIGVETNEATNALLLKEGRRERITCSHTTEGLSRVRRRRPRIQQSGITGLLVFSTVHMQIR
jgi:hypothetical protein